MNTKVKIAIVGCGGIANGKHMPSLKKFEDRAEMVAFCDLIPERAEKAAKEYGAAGAKVYTDYKEMLADKSVDIDVVHDWHIYPEMGGGMLFDWGSHLIDQILYMVDAPLETVFADLRNVINRNVDDYFNIMRKLLCLSNNRLVQYRMLVAVNYAPPG